MPHEFYEVGTLAPLRTFVEERIILHLHLLAIDGWAVTFCTAGGD